MAEVWLTEIASRLTLALLALLVSLVLFGPPSLYRGLQLHRPGMILHLLVRTLEAKLNRSRRALSTRAYRGFIVTGFLIVIAVAAGLMAENLAAAAPRFGSAASVLLIAWLVPLRPMLDQALAVNRRLRTGETDKARALIAADAQRSSTQLDEHTIIRTSIETLAVQFTSRLVAPILYYALFGLPGLFVCRLLELASHILGHSLQRLAAFGWATAQANRLLLYIPARLGSAMLLLAAIAVPGTKPVQASRMLTSEARKLVPSDRAWPIAAMACALGITLAGPRVIDGEPLSDPWVGPGSAMATRRELLRALYLFAVACVILFTALSCFQFLFAR